MSLTLYFTRDRRESETRYIIQEPFVWKPMQYEDISLLFGKIGNALIECSLNLQISNDISNLAFVRHLISYYTAHCVIGGLSSEPTLCLMELKSTIPSMKQMERYLKTEDITNLHKFELLSIKVVLDIHFHIAKIHDSPPYKNLRKKIIPCMIRFYKRISQAKFSIMISLYRAFAEDSRKRLLEMNSRAYSTPYSFIKELKQKLATYNQINQGGEEHHFYA
ncbi:unnamed protein product [Moneuplotes crassus]|uniref:Uncharacterized protein n=1 Tax=Euplotes crassus TaxID=5936 RepID=A0AAD1USK4_EUPCR|nr:unnamed protein product [Moneuplotes crassus]